MSVPPDEVRRIAGLARIECSEAEIAEYAGQLARVLDHMAELSRLDLSGAEPSPGPGAAACPLRHDEPRPFPGAADLLANAPALDGKFFRVPKVVD
jgi:aspartyl-tRNA(Asn)/glutamyl-tRNA(Gln) amidotransferase subunit C